MSHSSSARSRRKELLHHHLRISLERKRSDLTDEQICSSMLLTGRDLKLAREAARGGAYEHTRCHRQRSQMKSEWNTMITPWYQPPLKQTAKIKWEWLVIKLTRLYSHLTHSLYIMHTQGRVHACIAAKPSIGRARRHGRTTHRLSDVIDNNGGCSISVIHWQQRPILQSGSTHTHEEYTWVHTCKVLQ